MLQMLNGQKMIQELSQLVEKINVCSFGRLQKNENYEYIINQMVYAIYSFLKFYVLNQGLNIILWEISQMFLVFIQFIISIIRIISIIFLTIILFLKVVLLI